MPITKGRLKATLNDQIGRRSKTEPSQETLTLVNVVLKHKRMLSMLVPAFPFLKAFLISLLHCTKVQRETNVQVLWKLLHILNYSLLQMTSTLLVSWVSAFQFNSTLLAGQLKFTY